MSDTPQRHPITLKRFVYRLDGMDTVSVRGNIEYRRGAAGSLMFDLYYPNVSRKAGAPPVVVIVGGYRDVGVPLPLGCVFKDMEMSVSLAQLIAASGMAAVTYTTSEPAADVLALLDHLTANAISLGISGRLGLWAASGNVPVALSALMDGRRPAIAAAILSQGFTLDVEGTAVADAAKAYGFVNASATKSTTDLPSDVPLFIVRAGRDEFAGLNETLGRVRLCGPRPQSAAIVGESPHGGSRVRGPRRQRRVTADHRSDAGIHAALPDELTDSAGGSPTTGTLDWSWGCAWPAAIDRPHCALNFIQLRRRGHRDHEVSRPVVSGVCHPAS